MASDGFLYFGTDTNPATIVKVDPASFAKVGSTMLEEGNVVGGLARDGFGYFWAHDAESLGPSKLIKVDLSTPARVASIDLPLRVAVGFRDGDFAYFGSNSTPAMIAKVDLRSFQIVQTRELPRSDSRLSSSVVR